MSSPFGDAARAKAHNEARRADVSQMVDHFAPDPDRVRSAERSTGRHEPAGYYPPPTRAEVEPDPDLDFDGRFDDSGYPAGDQGYVRDVGYARDVDYPSDTGYAGDAPSTRYQADDGYAPSTGYPTEADYPADAGYASDADGNRPAYGQQQAGMADEAYLNEYFDDDEDEDEFFDQTSAVTRNALEWAVVLVGAVLVALLLRALVFQAFWIPSESMETTLTINDRVLVNKVSYHLHDLNRGDVVVFARPEDEQAEIRDLIKRVIALPGETVEGHDNSVYINGNRLVEPYLDDDIVTEDFGPVIVSEGHIFVMGDNRSSSSDSRVFGPVNQERVVGRAFVLFWPLNRLGSL